MAATDRRDRALILINPRARLAGARAWREPVIAELARRYTSEFVEPRDAADTTRLLRITDLRMYSLKQKHTPLRHIRLDSVPALTPSGRFRSHVAAASN